MTPLQLHVQKWRECNLCPLHETRRNVVLVRGVLPCDVAFVGEGPGKSEDVIGQPFVGPAGLELDDETTGRGWVQRSGIDRFRLAFMNLIACIPLDETGEKTEEPPDESVQACKPRLEELLRIARPRLIVAVGGCARDWLDAKYHHHVKTPEVPIIDIEHPASILRKNVAMRGIARQRAIVTLNQAVEEYLDKEQPCPPSSSQPSARH